MFSLVRSSGGTWVPNKSRTVGQAKYAWPTLRRPRRYWVVFPPCGLLAGIPHAAFRPCSNFWNCPIRNSRFWTGTIGPFIRVG